MTANKYGNKKCTFGGISFDSEREMKRYLVLKDAEGKGLISGLEVHRKYELIPAIKEVQTVQLKTKTKEVERTVQQAITYTCDFVYVKDGKDVIEDIKISEYMLPKEYVLKEKLMRWRWGITVRRVYKATEVI